MILKNFTELKLKLKSFIKNWNRNGNYVQNWNGTATGIISPELNWNWNRNYVRNWNITGPECIDIWTETWVMKVANLQSLERTERMMVRWMCSVSLKDRKRSVDLYSLLGVESMAEGMWSVRMEMIRCRPVGMWWWQGWNVRVGAGELVWKMIWMSWGYTLNGWCSEICRDSWGC